MALLIVAMGFVFGFTNHRWLVVLVAALMPAILLALGAFDDGEGAGTFALLVAVFAGLACVGLALSSGVRRLGARRLRF